ncbi:Uncharacterised protein [Mycobacteroides abscessus subsp. abscessus]|uniref:hypothetical protein n=1 Tax=Mycobacteroides abscessus TaxID=36809 RepID=UPI00092590CE|nr:hypothetical protein [Mycobacteroides abscessus]SIH92084.1 Uncharacterised protein [Mycobacteroides abscessus subsp. abscessus]
MNSINDPYANAREYFAAIDYGKHSNGRVNCRPSKLSHTPRHRAEDDAKVGA